MNHKQAKCAHLWSKGVRFLPRLKAFYRYLGRRNGGFSGVYDIFWDQPSVRISALENSPVMRSRKNELRQQTIWTTTKNNFSDLWRNRSWRL